MNIGCRVVTCYGTGTVVGYDLPYCDCWRHKVELDSGRLWGGNNPCFFTKELTKVQSILSEDKGETMTIGNEIVKLKVGDKVLIKTWESLVEEIGLNRYNCVKVGRAFWAEDKERFLPENRIVTINHFNKNGDSVFIDHEGYAMSIFNDMIEKVIGD